MNTDMKNCAKIQARIIEGDTTSPEVRVHLDSGCRECAETAKIWQMVRDLPPELLEAEPSKELDDAVKAAARDAVRKQLHRPFPAFLLWAGGAAAAFALAFTVLFFQNAETPGHTGVQTAQNTAMDDWDMTELNSGLSAMTGSIFHAESEISDAQSDTLGITQAEVDFVAYTSKHDSM